jgi:dTMP kinase
MMTMPLSEKSLKKLSGKFIVFDGPDGCGKSTQISRLMKKLDSQGVEAISVYDPGDTKIGGAIRSILLGDEHDHRDVRCELMLFMASRAQLVAEKIKPALAKGITVVSDRYVSASCAYQGAGGLNVEEIINIARFATNETWPDLTIILDIPPGIGFSRLNKTQTRLDAMERRGLEYHARVRDIFLSLKSVYPNLISVIDASGGQDQVEAKILETFGGVNF